MEKVAERQLTMKDNNSDSWYIAVKYIMRKNDFPDSRGLLHSTPTKFAWKGMVNKQINDYWVGFVRDQARLFLISYTLAVNSFMYIFGRSHHLLKSC